MGQNLSQLTLVLNESGNEPLVLECFWRGNGSRAEPTLRNVGRATPRLRALCILLLAAKYLHEKGLVSSALVRFLPISNKGNWIATLANDIQEVRDWVKGRFHIREEELFISGSVGSMHNRGGKAPMFIDFHPGKLSLSGLEIKLRAANGLAADARVIEGTELLDFALRIEAKHWKTFTLKQSLRLSEVCATEDRPPRQLRSGTFSRLFSDAVREILKETSIDYDSGCVNDIHFGTLVEKQFDNYRAQSQPLFAYMGGALNFDSWHFVSRVRTWERSQLALLRSSCHSFFVAGFQFASRFHREKAHTIDNPAKEKTWATTADAYVRWFSYFPKLMSVHLGINAAQYDELPCKERTLETWDYIHLLSNASDQNNLLARWGMLLGQQLLLVDFIKEVCLPLHLTAVHERSLAQEVVHDILFWKEQAIQTEAFVRRLCRKPIEMVEVAAAMRLLFKAQIDFYRGLHRGLILRQG